jgi:SAM-dependent methyltransferase
VTIDDRKLLEINKLQAAFYDNFHTNEAFNLPSRLWRQIRDRVRGVADVDDRIDAFEREVFNEVCPVRVLEVGCYTGRQQTDWLLAQPWLERYVGLELSAGAIQRFRERLTPAASAKCELIVGDFVAETLPKASFDLVYMHSVFHHFPEPRMVVERINDLLVPGGSFLTFDPLITNPVFRAVRTVYRPFQSDRHWEWPLQHAAFAALGEAFKLRRVQGYLGLEMYASILYSLAPLAPVAALRTRARQADARQAGGLGRGLNRCNFAAMHWQKFGNIRLEQTEEVVDRRKSA